MLQQPHQFGGVTGGDVGGPRLHGRDGFRIGHREIADPPLDGRGAADEKRRQIEALAVR